MSEETIFGEALQQTDPARRAAFLDAACAGDPQLRRRVEALLAAHAVSDSFLEPPAGESFAASPGDVERTAAEAPASDPDASPPTTQPGGTSPAGDATDPGPIAPGVPPKSSAPPRMALEGPADVIGPYKLL